MRYPETWTHEVLSESSLSGSAETGDKIWYGQVEFSGPEGKVGLTYGDGFGGAICGSQGSFLEGGVLETFTADYDEEFTMCKVPSVQLGTQSEYEYTWVGSCGDCGLLQNTTADQLTTYVFSIESNSENLEGSPIPQIISSLRFRFK